MHGTYDEASNEIHVTLSYDNVRDLMLAVETMRPNSRNSFTLSKRQMDGTLVVVEVNFEQGKRDWEGR